MELIAAENSMDHTPIEDVRGKVLEMEAHLLQMPQVEMPPRHIFAEGLYAREIFIPAGTILTGLIHKYQHLNFVCGDISVMTEEGVKRLTGYHTIVSEPGIKRAGFTHADTVWTTVHATTETDAENIENVLCCKTYEDFQQFIEHQTIPAIEEG